MECPVCFDVFKNPLLLPGCGHTVCQSCAEQLVTEGNFLRCPECRLVYQLRRGVHSLPKNVALQRTIEEHERGLQSGAAGGLMCETHPDDAVSLYCKTCEKTICLKCYFSNTLRKGETLHMGHQVDTSEDALTKEKRLLEEKCREFESRQRTERENIARLEESETRIKKALDDKLTAIEEDKIRLIAAVKQTSAKLKFTLSGSVARDLDYLTAALQSAHERLASLNSATDDAVRVLSASTSECPEINLLKSTRKSLEEMEVTLVNGSASFTAVENFDTDILSCLNDPKKALAYQTECPRAPVLAAESCVVSNDRALISVQYSETVRVRCVHLYYKEAVDKGSPEKDWDCVSISDISHGSALVTLTSLRWATMYKAYATASNDVGSSLPSDELWFRTVDCEDVDVHVVRK